MKVPQWLKKLKKKNWKAWTYLDTRGTRHDDPYMVLVLEPIDPTKTSPTYDDIFMFVDEMLKTEKYNDDHLDRPPQLPSKVERLLDLIYKRVE